MTTYAAQAAVQDEVVDQLRPYFSSVPRSILTSLMCVTGGVSWWEVEQYFLEISWILAGFFLLFIFVMLVAVLNVVTGVFVTDAVGRADADRDVAAALRAAEREALTATLISIFREVDIDDSGEITTEELHEMLQRDEIQALLSQVGIEALDHRKFFKVLDIDGSGQVSVDEFIFGITSLAGVSKQMDMMIFQAEMKTMIHRLHVKHRDMIALHAASHQMIADMKGQQLQFQETLDRITLRLSRNEVEY